MCTNQNPPIIRSKKIIRIYILIRYWMVQSLYHSVTLSVCLSVRYRNHFPVVQFQIQAHILNPHGTGQVFKTIWGAEAPEIWDAEGAPNSFIFFITAEGGVS